MRIFGSEQGEDQSPVNAQELKKLLDVELVAGITGLNRPIRGGYCGDLLSDVMANAPEGAVWMTVQSHQNIVAVAVLRNLAAIVLVNGAKPDDQTIEKADGEAIPLFRTQQSSYEIAGKLYGTGIGKTKE